MGTLTKLDLRVEFETCGNSYKIRFKSRFCKKERGKKVFFLNLFVILK
ncbi:hypothetical protein LEP1GSC018_0413 [Leptospira kirschneri str. 2008720114]|nr:hypothetical protein LEP1GSC018_0413 [Leptospira kirschneri str. 2008720114]